MPRKSIFGKIVGRLQMQVFCDVTLLDPEDESTKSFEKRQEVLVQRHGVTSQKN
jgi:hypothetical protein